MFINFSMKIVKRILLLLLVAALAYAVRYAWFAAPILTGYGAKAPGLSNDQERDECLISTLPH